MSRYPTLSAPYRDEPQAHSLSSLSQGRPESTELTDYWDNNRVPPPHRFSGAPANNNNFDPRDSLDHNPFDYTSDPFDPYSRQAPQPQGDMNNGYHYNNGAGARLGSSDNYDTLPLSNTERSGAWNEKPRSGNRKKYFIIGGIALVVIAIVAIIVGVVVSKNKSGGNSGSGKSSNPTKASSTPFTKGATANQSTAYFNVVPWGDNNDPSTFKKDANLKNALWAVAYTPFGSQLPNCGANLESVIEDIQLISQITTRIRLYGADCNQTAFVLDAIQRTKVDMSVWVGNYVVPDSNDAYTRQRDIIFDALKTFGVDHVEGITVGNEFMLNYLNSQGVDETALNTDVGNKGAQILIANIQDTRDQLKKMNFKKTIQVGTSDAGAFFNDMVLGAVDYGMANVHPWFANQTIDAAASWTTQFFQDTDIGAANKVANKPHMYIAETGWPTDSKDPGSSTNGQATASVDNLQTFINNFVCDSNKNNIDYFFFSAFDEPWKDVQFGGVEGHWGLFTFEKTLKSPLAFPDCSHS